MPRGQIISALTKGQFRESRDTQVATLWAKKLACQGTKHDTHTKQQKSSLVWYIHLNICFQFLNNIIRIFIYFITYTYFHTCFQTTKYIFLSVCTEHPPNILETRVVESIVWIGWTELWERGAENIFFVFFYYFLWNPFSS